MRSLTRLQLDILLLNFSLTQTNDRLTKKIWLYSISKFHRVFLPKLNILILYLYTND